MATKKTAEEVAKEVENYPKIDQNIMGVYMDQVRNSVNKLTVEDYAVAALQSLDWSQIGMGVDQAAKLCWSMAEAMVRNKP